MPDIVTLHLILLVGIVVGVFFTLIFDSSLLEKRLHEEKKEQIRLESKVVVTKSQVRHLRDELAGAKGWRKQAAHLLVEKEKLEQKLAMAESRLNHLDVQVEGTLQQLAEARKLSEQIVAVNEQNREARAKISKLNKKLRKAQKQVVFMRLNGKENLTLVRGIGPAYARRLQEGGIRTLSALALASPEQVCEIVQVKPWQNAAPKQWIAEARQLSAVFTDEEE